MNMISISIRFYNCHTFSFTSFSNNLPNTHFIFSIDCLSSIFWENTIWYLQFQVVCAKLFLSFMDKPPNVLIKLVGKPFLSLTLGGFLFEYHAKSFLDHLHSRLFSFIQSKRPVEFNRSFSIIKRWSLTYLGLILIRMLLFHHWWSYMVLTLLYVLFLILGSLQYLTFQLQR